jgi:hypothetical protein
MWRRVDLNVDRARRQTCDQSEPQARVVDHLDTVTRGADQEPHRYGDLWTVGSSSRLWITE